MQLVAISMVLTTLSLGALGSALPEAASLKARANGGVYMCTDINFSGQCIHLSNPFGDCINLDSNYNDKVSSVGPDRGSLCTFSKFVALVNFEVRGGTDWDLRSRNYGCSGAAYTLGYPGDSNLADGDGSFNDVISSYYCKAA